MALDSPDILARIMKPSKTEKTLDLELQPSFYGTSGEMHSSLKTVVPTFILNHIVRSLNSMLFSSEWFQRRQSPPSPCYFCCVWGFRTHQEFVNKVVWRGMVPYSTACLQLARNHQENDILVWLVRKYFPLHAGVERKVAVVLSRMFS